MKVSILILFVFIQFYSFSQSLEEREKITMGFEKSSDTKIKLFKIDSIQLKSDFLKNKNIDYKILGFRISGVDENGKSLFYLKSSTGNTIPKEFKNKLKKCLECHSIKVDLVTINWFTGTYTLKSSKMWNIK